MTTAASTNFPTTSPATSLTDAIQRGLAAFQTRLQEAHALLASLEGQPAIATTVAAQVVIDLTTLGVTFDQKILEGLENAAAVAVGRCGRRTEERLLTTKGARR